MLAYFCLIYGLIEINYDDNPRIDLNRKDTIFFAVRIWLHHLISTKYYQKSKHFINNHELLKNNKIDFRSASWRKTAWELGGKASVSSTDHITSYILTVISTTATMAMARPR